MFYNIWIEIYYSIMTGHKKKWETCLDFVYMIFDEKSSHVSYLQNVSNGSQNRPRKIELIIYISAPEVFLFFLSISIFFLL